MPKYVILDPYDNFVFNCKNQSHVFPNLRACRHGINSLLDEPKSENLTTGKIYTCRTDGDCPKDFRIFVEVVN